MLNQNSCSMCIKKQLISLLAIFVVGFALTSCGTAFSTVKTPVGMGGAYTGVEGPVTATSNDVGTSVGSAGATNILGILAIGDASINTAANSGNISEISHVDYKTTSVLGLFVSHKVYVYGSN